MRKITLMLAFLAFAGMTFAQKATCDLTAGGKIDDAVAKHQPKAFGDVIWSEDFDGAKWSGTVKEDGNGYLLDPDVELPEGWAITDGNELNYFWHWSNVGPRGKYVSTPWDAPRQDVVDALKAVGGTTDNGFMMLESAYFNTTPTGAMSSNSLEMDATLQYGPIDMSNAPGAIFNVKTMYRTCCAAAAQVGVAIGIGDGAGNIVWSDEIALNVLTPNNAYTYRSERDMHVNVSRVKAGSDFLLTAGASEVYFRLHQTASSHYLWLVDDITFYEPPTNDLIVEDTWFDYMHDATNPDFGQSSTASFNFWGGYTQIPQSVVAPFIQFRAAVNNNGTADATNAKVNVVIEKDGAEVYNITSTPKTVDKFLRDTLLVSADYSPMPIGEYLIKQKVSNGAVDQVPDNNSAEYGFNVVYDTYSRVTMGGEADFSTAGPGDWASGAFDGDVVAQPYDFPASVTEVALKAMKVYFALPATDEDKAAIIAGDFAMYARVYKIDEAGDIVDAGIASDLYTVQITDTNTWVTLEFLDEGNLVVPGGQTYYVGIETYTGFTPTNTARRRFEIGSDISGPKQPLSGGLVYLSSLDGWYSTGDNYAIDLVIATQYVLVNNVTVSSAGNATTISTLGGTLQMSAAVLPANATYQDVLWSVTNGTGKATISTSGLLTAILDGTVTVEAIAQDGSGIKGSMQITISNNPVVMVSGITVTGEGNASTISIFGGTLQMNATIAPANATNKAVTWSVTNESGKASISDNGLLSGEEDGTVTVTATSNDGSGINGTLQITITNNPVLVSSITVTSEGNATSITTDEGTLQMFATIFPENAGNKAILWTIKAGTGKATISTDGLVTSIENGTVTVIAKAQDESGVTGTMELTLSGNVVPVSGITVFGEGMVTTISTLAGTLQVSATVLPEDATNKEVTWSLTNQTGKATITADGLVTAQQDGTVKVVATAQDGSNVKGEMQITITNNPVIGISDPLLTADNITIYPNPVTDKLYVKMISSNSNIVIYNCIGTIIHQVIVNGAETTIDVSSYARGVYFIKVNDSDAQKFVK